MQRLFEACVGERPGQHPYQKDIAVSFRKAIEYQSLTLYLQVEEWCVEDE